MDIDIYHIIGWILAIGLTVCSLLTGRNKRTLPLVFLAGIVLAVGAGQMGGLAVVEPRWRDSRYLFGFLITSMGLVLWALPFLAKSDKARG
jgi:heme/copper-type cytochrome/quinol oxidase subunit 4